MIKLENINKYYYSGGQPFHALKDINLEFGESGMNFILGKSGSGKSTLLNIIGGIDSYDSGQLTIDNTSTLSFSKSQYNTYRNTYIGFIFQEFNVLKGLSVYENIAISLELQHLNVKEHHEQIQSIIDKVGLTGLESRMMNQLSGGQRQRVAIARSLIKNPRVIIADEPTGNLDSKNSVNIMNLLKELSKDRLVIIVTHNDQLAKEYSDRTIEIKDGIITKDTLNETILPTDYSIEPISVPTKTSLTLCLKAIKKNLKRFVFMILLFSIALIFAGLVINMYMANTTLTYAKYQSDYNNNIVNLVSNYKSYGYESDSAFFKFQINLFEEKYQQKEDEKTFTLLRGMRFDLPIDKNAVMEDDFYFNQIQYVYKHEDIPKKVRAITTTYKSVPLDQIGIFITDYVAENLIFQNYFGSSVKNFNDLVGKTLEFDNINYPLVIKAVLDTTYEEHKESFKSNDPKAVNAFYDNAKFYNSIILDDEEYQRFFSSDNILYLYSDIVYNMVADKGTGSNILFTTWDHSKEYIGAANGKAPFNQTAEGKPINLAVTTGFFEKILNVKVDENELADGETICDVLLKKVFFELVVTTENGVENKPTYATNFICVNSYIPGNTTFSITDVILDDKPIIYFTPNNEADDYGNFIKHTLLEGGFISLYFDDANDATKTNYNKINAALYRDFINNDINITNQSFTKVLLVDRFINNNLPLFLGVFFVFGLFSILLIFNFVIINIKNSTRDIGIYMSLGFSGWKISLIYLFQVIILGLIAFIISIVGTGIFLFTIDQYFTSLSSVNLEIIKMSFIGELIVLLIALIVPILSVIIPLINLSRKNPVDVIKTI